MPAVITSSHEEAQSEVPSSTPQMESQQIAEPLQEQQPERTPFNQQQDQGNVVFSIYTNGNDNCCGGLVIKCTDNFCYANENLLCQ